MLTTSESTVELSKALASAQKKIGFALKDQNNPYFKSKYADLASVWRAVAEPLSENGLGVSQSSDLEVHAERLFIVTTTRIQHSSGEWMEGTCYLPEPAKVDAQSYGASITYGRRYGLTSMLGVIQEDDDGESAVGRGVQQAEAEKPSNQKKEAAGKKQKATAAEKPGSADSSKSGSPPDRKTQLKNMSQWLQKLGAKSADDCELILKHAKTGVVDNPTWAECKESESVNLQDVGKEILAWIKLNSIEQDKVVEFLKQTEQVPA